MPVVDDQSVGGTRNDYPNLQDNQHKTTNTMSAHVVATGCQSPQARENPARER